MATATTTSRGLTLPCPCCGQAESSVALSLADGETFQCKECDAEFTADDVRAFIAKWSLVLAWIDTMPGTPD
jgi:transcription elongation factor Elf1